MGVLQEEAASSGMSKNQLKVLMGEETSSERQERAEACHGQLEVEEHHVPATLSSDDSRTEGQTAV